MNNKYFIELAHRLKQEGIATTPVDKACLPVLVDGREAIVDRAQGH